MRTEGAAVAPPRTVIIAGQVGQVWVSCWILLSATCILSAWAQGKNRDFFFFFNVIHVQLLWLDVLKRKELRLNDNTV